MVITKNNNNNLVLPEATLVCKDTTEIHKFQARCCAALFYGWQKCKKKGNHNNNDPETKPNLNKYNTII